VVVGDELCEQHFAGELQQGRHSKGWHGPTVLCTLKRHIDFFAKKSLRITALFWH
jgi:hypothetical protein